MYYHEMTINFNILTFIFNKKSHLMFYTYIQKYMDALVSNNLDNSAKNRFCHY